MPHLNDHRLLCCEQSIDHLAIQLGRPLEKLLVRPKPVISLEILVDSSSETDLKLF